MTKLSGATVREFKEALELMRDIYPFKDDKTRIVTDMDMPAGRHCNLEISTIDEATGVQINMQTKVGSYDNNWSDVSVSGL